MPYTNGMPSKTYQISRSMLFFPLKNSTPYAKSLDSSRLSQKKHCQREKKCIGNYIIGQKKANYLKFDEDIFRELPDSLRFSIDSPQTSLPLHATPCACSRRIKLYNYCPNHFLSIKHLSSQKSLLDNLQQILMCLEVMSYSMSA